MTNQEKTLSIIGILLVLYLLFKRKTLTSSATIRLLDPVTGFPVGDTNGGKSSFVIGEAVIPPGIVNDKNDAAFQFAAANGEITCPVGFEVVLDASNGKAYCMASGSDPNFGAADSQTPEGV